MSSSQGLEAQLRRYEAAIGQAEEYLTSRGLSIEDASSYRLGVVSDDSPESAPYKGRLAIPYLTPAGVKDIRFRTLDGMGPKYLSRPGAPSLMFNVGALWRDSDTIAVCEGEMDTIVMDLFSGVPAVGIPGANVWKNHYGKLFSDYERVLIIGDGDSAGRDFAKEWSVKVDSAIPVIMREGMDVNELFLLEGPSAIEKLAA